VKPGVAAIYERSYLTSPIEATPYGAESGRGD
jgi:hypothetical protein